MLQSHGHHPLDEMARSLPSQQDRAALPQGSLLMMRIYIGFVSGLRPESKRPPPVPGGRALPPKSGLKRTGARRPERKCSLKRYSREPNQLRAGWPVSLREEAVGVWPAAGPRALHERVVRLSPDRAPQYDVKGASRWLESPSCRSLALAAPGAHSFAPTHLHAGQVHTPG